MHHERDVGVLERSGLEQRHLATAMLLRRSAEQLHPEAGVGCDLGKAERRADAVKKYLISKGVPANRVYTEGKGEKMPVTGDKCKNMGPEYRRNKKLIDCLQPDRRVEIQVIGTDK